MGFSEILIAKNWMLGAESIDNVRILLRATWLDSLFSAEYISRVFVNFPIGMQPSESRVGEILNTENDERNAKL